MEKPEPIRTELFRFKTLKPVDKISEKKKKVGFIEHPNPSKSHFLSAVTSTKIDQGRSEVREVKSLFKPISTVAKIRQISPDYMDFSDWINLSKDALIYSEAKSKASHLTALSDEQLITLWDNIFYDILDNGNHPIRQACIQLLIAHYFSLILDDTNFESKALEFYDVESGFDNSEWLNKFAYRWANAKLIIPKVFSAKKYDRKGSKATQSFSSEVKGQFQFKYFNMLKNYSANQFELVRKDMLDILVPEFNNTNFINLRSSRSRSLFSYDRLSDDSKDVMKHINVRSNNPGRIDQSMKKNIAGLESKAYKYAPQSKTVRLHHGKKSNNPIIDDYCYLVSIGKAPTFLHITLKLKNREHVKNSKYQLTQNDKGILKSDSIKVLSNKEGMVLISLFEGADLSFKTLDYFTLTGMFTLNNGKQYIINQQLNVFEAFFTGCLEVHTTDSQNHATGNDSEEESENIEGNNDTDESDETIKLYGVNRLGIGAYYRVEQEVCCYVPGEVSRIENVMAREYKERHTRQLTKTDSYEESNEQIEVEQQSDTATTNRNEMNSEINNAINKAMSFNAGASFNYSNSVGPVTISAGANFGTTLSNATTNSTRQAQSFAEEVTQNALDRVLQKVSQKRSNRVIKEFEENNRHGFDNRSGDEHVSGVYRWVDIIYKNSMVNYGNRLMVEFLIPEPAKLYKWAIDQELEETGSSNAGSSLQEPIHPEDLEILGPENISRTNYTGLISRYDVLHVQEPPSDTDPTPVPISCNEENAVIPLPIKKSKENNYSHHIDIPGEHVLKKIAIRLDFEYHWGPNADNKTYFEIECDDYRMHMDGDGLIIQHDGIDITDTGTASPDKFTNQANPNNPQHIVVDFEMDFEGDNWAGHIPIKVSMKNVHGYNMTVIPQFGLNPDKEIAWQESVYNAILNGYHAQLSEYERQLNQSVEEAEAAEKEKVERNPDFNRAIELRELQRSAIEMLTAPFGRPLGEDFYFDDPSCENPVPQIEQTEDWEKYSSQVKFLQQAFEWELMDYIFYPYFWGDKCSWAELIQTTDSADPLFESFLQSGMARMVVPVRRGFIEAVDLYLETGGIWNGGSLVINTDDDLYVSISEETEETKGEVGEVWQSRVPSTLTVIQSDTVALDATGLPCCDFISESQLKSPDNRVYLESKPSADDNG